MLSHSASFLTSTHAPLPVPPATGKATTSQSTPASESNPPISSTFQLQECTQEDIPRFFELVSVAFAHGHPYIDAEFPSHDKPKGRAAGTTRMLDLFRTDKSANWLKIVSADGKMIAGAKWNVYDGKAAALPDAKTTGDWWENGEEKDYALYLSDTYLINRRKKFDEARGRLLSLEYLMVDPQWQRKGAGTLLTQWGTKMADNLGVDAIVEATAVAVPLYRKNGFELHQDFTLQLPEKWKDRPKQRICWMVRSPVKKT